LEKLWTPAFGPTGSAGLLIRSAKPTEGDVYKGFRFLFVSPFEGLKYSSLRLCRR